MKQFCTLLLLLPLVFGSCDKDNDTRIETWTVASEKGVAGIFMGFGHVPAYILKTGPNAGWEISTAHIEGFTFEKGYQTEMLVRIEPIPLRFSPEFEVTIASERGDNRMTAYWFKDMRYPDPRWEPFPWEIEGFDFKPGFEARIRIRPVAEYDEEKGDYEVKYHQTELISSEEKASEGLPE